VELRPCSQEASGGADINPVARERAIHERERPHLHLITDRHSGEDNGIGADDNVPSELDHAALDSLPDWSRGMGRHIARVHVVGRGEDPDTGRQGAALTHLEAESADHGRAGREVTEVAELDVPCQGDEGVDPAMLARDEFGAGDIGKTVNEAAIRQPEVGSADVRLLVNGR